MERYGYGKFLRITSCIQRFLQNYNILQLERKSGPLATKELESSEILWVRTIQTKTQDTPKFKDDTEKLNFQLDKIRRIYICKGHITGDYPIYIPSNTLMSKNTLVAHAHLKTFTWGVGYTVREVRERFWIQKLHQLTKCVNHKWDVKVFEWYHAQPQQLEIYLLTKQMAQDNFK